MRSRGLLLALNLCHVVTLFCILQFCEIPANAGGPPDGQRGVVITPPVVIYSPQPESPPNIGNLEHEAKVQLFIDVDEQGNVNHGVVTRSQGHELDQNALAIVRTWKFRPAMKDGQPIRVRLMVEVTYKPIHSPHRNAQCPVPFAFGTTELDGPMKVTWEDFPGGVDRWWVQQEKAGKFSSLCLASPGESKYAVIWNRPSDTQSERPSHRDGSGLPGGAQGSCTKGVAEVFSVTKGDVNPPALFTSKKASCKKGIKEAVGFMAKQTAKEH